ncbi:protein yellow-like [Copidosoma floridanum]|uniref:protein yellow-like n=1 Tax=Copidosoma floridanum TaxID=29053 RepID=UPI0006C93E34|nr:protein yellow-like [Copidosoma floridanum]
MYLRYGVLLSVFYTITLARESLIVQCDWGDKLYITGINYTWPSYKEYQQAVENRSFAQDFNTLEEMKFWKDNMYVAMEPWRSGGVPVALAMTPVSILSSTKTPRLKPYPNWEMQKVGGDCSGFQAILGIEIDPMGRLWVLDSGYFSNCGPRLLILDLEDGGKVLMSYSIPSKLISCDDPRRIPTSSEIVLDHEDGGFAYIKFGRCSDIIVFSLKNRTSWKFSYFNNLLQLAVSPADSEGNRKLYCIAGMYAPKVFEVSTRALKDKTLHSNINQEVKELGWAPSKSNEITISNKGIMFVTTHKPMSFYKWELNSVSFNRTRFKYKKGEMYFDLFKPTFDERGNLWFKSTRGLALLSINLKIEKIYSYQYYGNGSMPKLPVITDDAWNNRTAP